MGSILLICVVAIIPLGLAKGLGLPHGKAAWLMYVLFYLMTWVHYPQLFEVLIRNGLGLASLGLLVLFLLGIWKVVWPRNGFSQSLKPDVSKPLVQQPNPQRPEIKHEAEKQTVEAKATAREALPLTIKELRSVEDMEKALKQTEKIIATPKPKFEPQ